MNVRKFASIGLAAVLQVLPLTRVFVAATPATGSSFAIIATWIAGAAALLGGVDAVSGASTTITSAPTARGTNGVAFSYRITTGPQTANTFAAAPLPTGLVVSTTSGKITGTPTVEGVFVVLLTASDSGIASRTVKTNLTLTIVAGSGGGGTAPSITTQPISQTVTAGANVNFSVVASGTAPLSYQWRLGGANIAGATSATLTLNSVTTGQSGGSYTCVVSNTVGTATSSAATLTVNPAPVAPAITTQPTSQTVTAGANVSFTVAASGTAPLSYQWQLGGANLAGATSATLTLNSVTTGQSGGSYSCVVSNAAGTATSSAATLTVNPAVIAPTIMTQPVSQTVTAGANVTFSVAASGTAPLSYQWRLGGANITGATSATLSLTSVTTGQSGGSYTCVVSNSAGVATSSAANLTVNPAPVAPTITTQPVSQTVTAGANVSFIVAASGTAPLSYQWLLNGGNISGATSATLTLTSVTTGQSGGSYSCVVSNVAGSATSSAATLTVNPAIIAPTITTPPANQSVTAGANASFTVVASGTAPLTYQWRLNGGNIAGETGATLTLTGVTIGQSGGSYSCVVSNVAGSATSSAATLTVTAAAVAPTITTAPVSQTVTAGTNVTFSVVASGTAPLSYQWRLNGGNIAGATSSTLTLTSVTTGQSGGSYSVVVTNVAGNATSSAATLTVNPAPIAPTITTQPVTQTVTAGTNVSFTVAASGTALLSYQWRLNGGNIVGATSATLTLTSVTTGQSGGSYSCFVSNIAGSATSAAATLTVNPAPVAPVITLQPISQTVTAGTNVSFTVAASGTTPLTYQWRLNGGNIGGATSATLTLTSVTTGQSGGNYSCFVSNIAGSATSAAATLTVNPAPVAPTITVQPVSQTVTAGTNVSFSVAASGTAPLSYQWRLNGGNIVGATSATLTLTGVTTGQAGNYSCVVSNSAGSAASAAATLTVNAVMAQPSKLTVTVQGQGTVYPNLNGSELTIGKVYTLNAMPAAGYSFSGWLQSAQQLSASATISFVMTSNLVLSATFIPDPMVAVAGTYNGLFYQTDAIRLAAAGAFNLRADTAGNFSAWVQIGYSRYQFSGKLDANMQATSVVTRWDGTPLTVQFTIGQDATAGQITGSVTDGVWSAPLSGGRSVANSPFAGEYTVVIPGTSGNAALPAGDGYATLHVAADGLGTLSGTLADGTSFAQSAYVTANGDWPLYVSMYVGKGALISWLTFADQATSDVSGDLVWIKQAGASATSFPLGFTNGTKAVGSIYIAPDATGKAVNLAGAVASFSGGSLATPFNNVVSVNAGSQVVNLSVNALTLTITTASGVFSGQVSEPGNGVAHKFSGVILQKQNAGYGTMIGTPNGSRVVLGAP